MYLHVTFWLWWKISLILHWSSYSGLFNMYKRIKMENDINGGSLLKLERIEEWQIHCEMNCWLWKPYGVNYVIYVTIWVNLSILPSVYWYFYFYVMCLFGLHFSWRVGIWRTNQSVRMRVAEQRGSGTWLTLVLRNRVKSYYNG